MARPSQSRSFLAGLTGAVAVALAAGALAPPSASAGIIPNPIDAVKGIVGVPGDVAGELGATVLQEALEWLLGGIKAAITLELVKFLTAIELPVGSSLAQVTGPMIVIGGFFLVVGLITSIGDGYREIIAGTDTAPRVIGQAIFRVIGLALLLGAWYWIVPLAVDVANGMSGYVLSDDAVAQALRRTFAADQLLRVGFPLLGLLTAIALAMSILTLVAVDVDRRRSQAQVLRDLARRESSALEPLDLGDPLGPAGPCQRDAIRGFAGGLCLRLGLGGAPAVISRPRPAERTRIARGSIESWAIRRANMCS